MTNCFVKLIGQVCAFNRLDGHFLFAVLSAFRGKLSKHHLRVLDEILVDAVALRRRSKMHPFRLMDSHAVSLLKEKNIGNNTRIRIALKRIVREPNRANQISPICYVLSDRFALLVHGASRGYNCYNASRPRQIKRFCDEIIVDQEIETIIFAVIDFVLAEGDITNHAVEETIGELRRFKALDGNLVFLVQLLSDPARNTIKLHAVHAKVAHAFGYKPHEITDATRRFKHIARGQSNIFKSFVHGLDYSGRRIKCVQSGSSGLSVLFRRKCGIELLELVCPGLLAFVKGFWNTTPTDVSGKHFLLFRSSITSGKL